MTGGPASRVPGSWSGDPTLRVLSGLRLPYPERIRFAREVQEDLAELARELEARGCAPAEASRRAQEMLLPAGTTLEALERLHQPLYQRLTERFAPERMRRWERSSLGLLTGVSLAGAVLVLARADLLDAPSPFLGPVLVLGVLGVTAALAKAFHLFIKGEHAPHRLRAGLGLTPALAGLTLLAAGGGFLIDLHALAKVMEAGPPDPGPVLLGFTGSASALLACGLVLALLSGLLWFLLLQWIAGVEQAERELGSDAASRQPPSGEVLS
jgi:hypothetical protein